MKKLLLVLLLSINTVSFANVLQNSKILELIPQDTWGVALANDLDNLVQKLGKEQIIANFNEQYQSLVQHQQQAFGVNLFTKEGLAEKGIDAQKPCGFILFDGIKGYMGFTFTISDIDKLHTFLKLTGGNVQTKQLANATLVYRASSIREFFIIRDNCATLFFIENYQYISQALSYAENIAQTKAEDSLAKNAIFQKCVTTLNFGKDIGAYVNIQSILKSTPVGQDEQMIEQMAGQPALAIGAELQHDSLQFKSFFHLAPQAVLGSLLQENHTPNLLFALKDNPLAYLSFALDIPSIVETATSFAPPGQMEQMDTEFQQMFQMSFSEIISLFSGELGIAVTGNPDSNITPQTLQSLEASFTIGITHKEKTQNLLNKIVEMQMIPLPIQSNNGVFQIQVPEWQAVSITVTNNHIVISSDEKVTDNLQNLKSDNVMGQLVKLTQPMVIFNMDLTALGYFVLYNSTFDQIDTTDAGKVDAMVSGVAKHQEENASPEYLAKKKELEDLQQERQQAIQKLQDERRTKLDKITAKLKVLENERRKLDTEMTLKLFKRFGQLTASASKTSNGVIVSGGLFTRVPTKEFIPISVSDVNKTMEAKLTNFNQIRQLWGDQEVVRREYDNKEQKLNVEYNVKIDKLQQELQQLRGNK